LVKHAIVHINLTSWSGWATRLMYDTTGTKLCHGHTGKMVQYVFSTVDDAVQPVSMKVLFATNDRFSRPCMCQVEQSLSLMAIVLTWMLFLTLYATF
jgi:hypothetical protein